MKVLHVHQIAHIPQLLVSNLKQQGIQAEYLEEATPNAIKSADIVHGHYALNRHTIAAFRMARKYNKPFILHCHGSDLRLLTGNTRIQLPFHLRKISEHLRRRSSRILLSTPDLEEFEPEGEYIPNPVDIGRFRPMHEISKSGRHLICGKQVRGSNLLDFIEKDVQYDCVNTGYQFKFPANVKMLPYVDYSRFHEFLNGYEVMIGTVGDVISMARLEAMSCGLRTFTDFPEEFTRYYDGQNPDKAREPRGFVTAFHDPKNSAAMIIKVYEGILHP